MEASKKYLIPRKFCIRLTKKFKAKLELKHLNPNPVLEQIDVISCFEALRKKFVLLAIDKAPNNVAVICKWYYVEVVFNETGAIVHGNNTYCKTNQSCNEIIDQNRAYTQKSYRSCTGILKCIRIQQRHVSRWYLKLLCKTNF